MNNANQPAHPITEETGYWGLTKREYIAAMAMQSLITSDKDVYNQFTCRGTAARAISYADELLKQLES